MCWTIPCTPSTACCHWESVMSKLPDAIKRLVGELDITPDGAISVAGKRYLAPAPGASEAQISNNLATCIYHLAYLQSTAPGSALAAGHSDINLSGIIRQANAGKTAMASDWILVELLPDNAVLASRHGKTRRFQAGQFLAIDGEFPLTPGTGLLVRHINGSDKLQHGFHYCFGDGHQDPNDKSPMVRLYWNVRVAQVAVFTSLLTTALNRYKIPFNFKITNHVADFDRADNAVLYVSERWFRIVTLALEPVLPQLLRTLDQYVPLFTKRLAHGIGIPAASSWLPPSSLPTPVARTARSRSTRWRRALAPSSQQPVCIPTPCTSIPVRPITTPWFKQRRYHDHFLHRYRQPYWRPAGARRRLGWAALQLVRRHARTIWRRHAAGHGHARPLRVRRHGRHRPVPGPSVSGHRRHGVRPHGRWRHRTRAVAPGRCATRSGAGVLHRCIRHRARRCAGRRRD